MVVVVEFIAAVVFVGAAQVVVGFVEVALVSRNVLI